MRKATWKHIAKHAISEALAQFVGHNRHFTRHSAAAAIGCSARSLANWQQQHTAPEMSEFLAQCKAFGPEFVNLVLAHVGITGARWVDSSISEARAAHASVARLGAAFADAYEDGHIDHQERAAIIPLASDARQKIESFIHHERTPRHV